MNIFHFRENLAQTYFNAKTRAKKLVQIFRYDSHVLLVFYYFLQPQIDYLMQLFLLDSRLSGPQCISVGFWCISVEFVVDLRRTCGCQYYLYTRHTTIT